VLGSGTVIEASLSFWGVVDHSICLGVESVTGPFLPCYGALGGSARSTATGTVHHSLDSPSIPNGT